MPTRSDSIALDYGKAVGVCRRHVRFVLAAALILVGGVLVYLYGRSAYIHVRQWYLYRQLLAWREPADRVVYEPDETRWNDLRAAGDYKVIYGPKPHLVRRVPQCRELRGRTADDVPLFLHARAAPREQPQLVAVSVTSWGWKRRVYSFDGQTPGLQLNLQYEIGPATGVASVLIPIRGWDFDEPRHPRFYVGQPDPADPSRFTIPFEIDNQRGVIDGQLLGNNMLVLNLRDPPTTVASP